MPISSPIMVLPLVAVFASPCGEPKDGLARGFGVAAPMDLAARRDRRLELLQILGEIGEGVVLQILCAGSRRASNSGRAATVLARVWRIRGPDDGQSALLQRRVFFNPPRHWR